MLEIKNLNVEVEGKEILQGVTLSLVPEKILALMGPNGSGKSTLVQALAGHPKYKITAGKIILDGKEITNSKPEERAKAGLFLSFQSPPIISGISVSKFLRTAVNSQREYRGEKPYSIIEFHALLKETVAKLGLPQDFIKRDLNKGFSGGERKKMEILQMFLLQPKYVLLDETDSGLDVDAIKIVGEGINLARQRTEMSLMVITHYHKFLQFLLPDTVAVLSKGSIIASGQAKLAEKIEKEGFGGIIDGYA